MVAKAPKTLVPTTRSSSAGSLLHQSGVLKDAIAGSRAACHLWYPPVADSKVCIVAFTNRRCADRHLCTQVTASEHSRSTRQYT